MKNRMIAWVSGVVLVVVTLMVIIVKLEPPRDGIIRAQAMKAMALALTGKEECEKRAKERGTSHFSAKEKDNWWRRWRPCSTAPRPILTRLRAGPPIPRLATLDSRDLPWTRSWTVRYGFWPGAGR